MYKAGNLILLSRIFFTPIFLFFFYIPFQTCYICGTVLFFMLNVMQCTSAIIAKYQGGIELDEIVMPFADKILLFCSLILLIDLGYISKSNIVLVYIIIIRDMLVIAMRLIKKTPTPSINIIKNICFYISIQSFLLDLCSFSSSSTLVNIGNTMLITATFISLISLIQYINTN